VIDPAIKARHYQLLGTKAPRLTRLDGCIEKSIEDEETTSEIISEQGAAQQALTVKLPQWGQVRSLNVGNAAAVLLYEAYRQTNLFPGDT
jgi:hypothetical protein